MGRIYPGREFQRFVLGIFLTYLPVYSYKLLFLFKHRVGQHEHLEEIEENQQQNHHFCNDLAYCDHHTAQHTIIKQLNRLLNFIYNVN